jgi:hypothetical protein
VKFYVRGFYLYLLKRGFHVKILCPLMLFHFRSPLLPITFVTNILVKIRKYSSCLRHTTLRKAMVVAAIFWEAKRRRRRTS